MSHQLPARRRCTPWHPGLAAAVLLVAAAAVLLVALVSLLLAALVSLLLAALTGRLRPGWRQWGLPVVSHQLLARRPQPLHVLVLQLYHPTE